MVRFYTLFLLLLFWAMVAPVWGETEQERLLKYGDFYYKKRQLSKALSYYDRAVKGASSKDIAYFKRGMAHNMLDHLDAALADFNVAIRLNPTMSDAYAWRGENYSDMGQFEKAVADFNRAMKMPKPNRALILRRRCAARTALGNLDGAIADATRAIGIYERRIAKRATQGDRAPTKNIDLAKLYQLRGNIYYNRREYTKAVADFTSCINYGFTSDQILDLRARANAADGKVEAAIADYDLTLKLNPRDDSAYAQRGKLFLKLGKTDRAVADLTRAIELYPGENTSRLYLLRADAYKKKGDLRSEKADRQKASSIRKSYF
ncbi:MAG TPA: tetratricopeptide repeat protein [Candidatus Melainabacteria bacterium]|nr:tetratricopeptide repeat protein [Candidatus Melainabacteria bacterium]